MGAWVGCWLCASWMALVDPSGDASTTTEGPISAASVRTRVWIRHPRDAHESLATIARRYGVTTTQLQQWNPDSGKRATDDELVRVQVDAERPPLQPVYTRVGAETSWQDIADRYGTTVEAVQAANPRHADRKRPPKGARLIVWVPSEVQRLAAAAPDDPLPTFAVEPGGVAVGPPHHGRLEGGVKLPDSELYTIRFEKLCFGTSLAVADIQSAIAGFRQETGFEGELFIGALSREKGRRLRPHKSHRTGRDVDVRLPALPHAEGYKLERDEIDWPATWALVDAFARTGDVHMIFLERKLWSRLRRAALRSGATDADIDRAFAVIRHSKGHTGHIHVRFVCSPDATECRD